MPTGMARAKDISFVDRVEAQDQSPAVRLARALDLRRRAAGIAKSQWAREAQTNFSVIQRILKAEVEPRPTTLAALRRGLDRLIALRGEGERLSDPHARAIYSGFLLAACRALDVPEGAAHAIDPANAPRGNGADEVTRRIHRARAVALYLANVQIGISQGQLARVLGIHKAAVSRSISRLEDARDGYEFDQIVRQAALAMNEGDLW